MISQQCLERILDCIALHCIAFTVENVGVYLTEGTEVESLWTLPKVGPSACLVNRKSWFQILAVPSAQAVIYSSVEGMAVSRKLLLTERA